MEAGIRVWLHRIFLVVAALFVVIQARQPSRINPPVDPDLDIKWYVPVTPGAWPILARSCDDCHSNRTVWPWYSAVAPISWLVANDVSEGRSKMNLSEWGSYPLKKRLDLLKGICEEVTEGKMPPAAYALMHPSARLAPGDVKTLCQWTRTFERPPSNGVE
jgi:hypothetical protein